MVVDMEDLVIVDYRNYGLVGKDARIKVSFVGL